MAETPSTPQEHPAQFRWNAILLAGDRPGIDPLAEHFGVASKALVPVAGQAMASRVLSTLVSHPLLGKVHVLAQEPDRLFSHPDMQALAQDPRVIPVVAGRGIARSIAEALRLHSPEWPLLVTTADHVLLSREMIDSFIGQSGECDVAVGVVTKATFASEGMDSARTWMPFRGAEVTGANLFALKTPRALVALEYWQKMEDHRKKPLSMAWRMGPRLLLAVLLKRLTVEDAVAALGRKLGIRAHAVRIPHARAGVDVDKLRDHQLVTQSLASDRTEGAAV